MIDKHRLLHFCDGDRELAARVLVMMKSEIDDAVGRLADLLKNQEWETLSNTAHKLKSHGDYIGAITLVELAKQLETQAATTSGIELSELIRRINAEAALLPDTL